MPIKTLLKHFNSHPAVDCGSLDNPTNGMVNTPSGTTFMNTATYMCVVGYTLTGSETQTCNAEGTWTPDPPTCVRK